MGIFAGLTFGGALGMDRGMHRLRESLPRDSHLLSIIHENDNLKQQQQETLFSGPVDAADESTGVEDLLSPHDDSLQELEIIENQLLIEE